MKNSKLVIAVVIVLALGVLGVYAMMTKNPSQIVPEKIDTPTASVKNDSATTASNGKIVAQSEKYIQFSPEVLANSADKRRVLFFYANWCPTCKVADEEFSEQSSQLPDDVTLIRVNYNDTDTDQVEKDLARKHTITYQHTFVQIDEEGNEVVKWNGGKMAQLLSNLK